MTNEELAQDAEDNMNMKFKSYCETQQITSEQYMSEIKPIFWAGFASGNVWGLKEAKQIMETKGTL